MTAGAPPPAATAEAQARGPAPAPTTGARPDARLDAIDWLRGLAVVLMIQTHLYDSWLGPSARATDAFWWTRFLGGIPARLFLFLVGVSMAIRFEGQLRKGIDRATMCRGVVRRGTEILGLAYLFRLQEFALGGFGGNWRDLFRIDILNCIGASMIVTPALAAPRGGRPRYLACLLGAAFFLGLGPLVGPAHFPDWLPRPLTSYLGGERPMAWFPLFPWAAWSLVGVAVGHWWVRASADPRRQRRAYLLSAIGGAAMTGAVILIRRIDPYVIRYPSELVQQMGPGSFFYRLGLLGPLALLGYGVTRVLRGRFSVMRQFGRTSLLVYWIHVDLCYGLVSKPLHHRLTFGWATLGLVAMVVLMLAISLLKTRYWKGWRGQRQRRPAMAG
ncbi:MAG TPA: heparan-alpha-glucosaminide N-acetyltransferase domain-containing protein [Polyangia bacterium]|nr:heparan-alpha-glucosaminide N-acetyltransferase domain-containing protein [Polyangia bacterium]